MKLSFDVKFTKEYQEHYKKLGISLEEVALTNARDSLFPKIKPYIDIQEGKNTFGEKEVRGEVFVLHKKQVDVIESMLNILVPQHVKEAVIREIVQM